MSLWTLIPLLVFGYLIGIFPAGLLFVVCSQKTTEKLKEEEWFEGYVFGAILWPVVLPVSTVVFIIMNVGVWVSHAGAVYSEFLEVAHRKVHAKRNQRVAS